MIVAWYHLHAMEDCSYAPLAREMTTMVHEERFHASFGARRARDLARDPAYQELVGAGMPELQAAVDKWYPKALDTFGKSDSEFAKRAVAYGIRRWDNAELRRMYQDDIEQKFRDIGLTVPPAERGRKIM